MKVSVYWIDGPWLGRLSIAARPRGGDWLEDEIDAWKGEGIRSVVSTLTKEETDELDLSKEPELCQAKGLDFLRFAIADRGVPNSSKATMETIRNVEEKLKAGKNVLIHCRQGIGRSGLLAACLLGTEGLSSEAAFSRIAAARGAPVPDTVQQKDWVDRFLRENLHDLMRLGAN